MARPGENDGTSSARPRRRLRRRLLRAAAALALLVVLAAGLLVAGALAVSMGWQRARVTAAIESLVGDALGTPVRMGALRGPLIPRLEIEALRVGPEGAELASARRLVLRLDLRSRPPAGPLVIEALEIEGLHLTLRRDESGWRLPWPAPGDDGGGPVDGAEGWLPFAIHVHRTQVRDSRVEVAWSDAESPGSLVGAFEAQLDDLRLAAQGPATFGPASLSVSLEQGSLGGQRVDRGALEAQLEAGHELRFMAVGAGGFGEIGIQGRGDLDAWLASRIDPETRIDLTFDALDLEVLSGGELPATQLAGRAELGVGERRSATTGAPEIAFVAILEPSRLGPVDLSAAELHGRLLEDEWQLDDLSVQGEGLSLTGRAAGTGSAPRLLDLRARVERLGELSQWLAPVGAAGALGPEALSGSLSLELELEAPPQRPRAVEGRIAARARNLVRGGAAIGDVVLRARIRNGQRAELQTFTLQGERLSFEAEPGGVLRLAGATLSDGVVVEGLALRSQEARLAVAGRVGRDALHALHLRLSDLDAARIGAFEGVAEPSAGSIAADLVLDGPFDAPRAEGWVTLRDGAAWIPALGETFAPIDARLQLEDEALVVERLTVGPPGARATLSGRVELADLRPGRAELRLRVEDFALTRVPLPRGLAGGAGSEEPGDAPASVATGGRVDADLTVTGPLLAPTISGDLAWSEPRWQDVQLEHIALHLQADESFASGRLRVRYEGSEILAAEGRLPVPDDPGEPLDWLADPRGRIDVRGESLDFALLARFLPRLVRSPRGRADLTLVVQGGRPEPRIDGELVVADGSIRIPLLGQTFAPVSGVARFDGRRVRLESLSVGTPEAGLTAEGSLELVDLRPERVDLAIRLSDFPVSRSSLVRANVDGRVELRGPLSAPALTGELALRDTRITVRGSDQVAQEVRVRASARDESLRETGPSGPSLLDRASADLSFTVPGGTWIRSSDLELDVEGWARLQKRSLEPARYSGRLETRRGTVRVVGRRFELRRGEASLDGGSQIDPVLDVVASHRVADVRIVAYVTGRVSEPVLRLDSEPPMSEDEVASYLFFGRPPNQLGAGEQGDVSLAAAGLAAGMALDELRDVFGHDLPIDTVEIRIEEGDEPSRVEVGKYIARDVFVRFGQSFGSETFQEVGVSYRLGEHWLIESTTSSNATAGADLYWTIDW